MSSFLLKFTGYKNYVRLLEYVLKPVFNINKWSKVMPYHKEGTGGLFPHNGRQHFKYDDYDFDRRTGHETPPHKFGGRFGAEFPHFPVRRYPHFPPEEPPVDVSCGELRPSYIGSLVHMKGRVQYQRLNRFIQLRDSQGTTQLVALEERIDLIKRIRNIPVDSHIEVVGQVQRRPINTINNTMATGEIEVILENILDVAKPKRKLFEDVQAHRVMQAVAPNTLIVVKGKVLLRPSHQRNTRMATGGIEVKVNSLEVMDPNEPEPVQAGDKEVKEEPMEVQEGSNSNGPPPGDVNSYTGRSHTCGQLRGGDAGAEVTLCGWLDSQRGSRFGTLRDGHGKTQILVPAELEATLGKKMAQTPMESVVKVVGTVCARPPEQINEIGLSARDPRVAKRQLVLAHCGAILKPYKKQETGEIEVVVKDYIVLNPARREMPFVIRDHNKPKEPLRMKYRYLDLRFASMQYRMRLRSRVLTRMREFLVNQRGFVEVETPTLFRRTPGGAQEYVVPTRAKDKFYSLVQSPQQLKQLLMVGAMDRYFQVAKCYRDEGARPDRQPEFTQMDIELSFTDRDSILALIQDLLKVSWPEELQPLQTPFPVLSYHDAMHLYGSDKPDLSFDCKLVDIGNLITEEKKQLLPEHLRTVKNFTAKALFFSQNDLHKLKESFQECETKMKDLKAGDKAKLMNIKCTVPKCDQELAKALPFVDLAQLKEQLKVTPPGAVVVGLGKESVVLPLMGKLRQDVLSNPTSNFHFAWIVDFPLFLEGDDGNIESAHHPFTAPFESDLHLLDSDPYKVRGLHYDLVLNGYEVGGGSVRIHDAVLQTKVLQDILKIPTDSLEHLLEALRSGAPPHGGIALGMDRLLAVMTGAETIRDVIAFPKGFDGKDPLSGAPCEISEEEKKMYHLSLKD